MKRLREGTSTMPSRGYELFMANRDWQLIPYGFGEFLSNVLTLYEQEHPEAAATLMSSDREEVLLDVTLNTLDSVPLDRHIVAVNVLNRMLDGLSRDGYDFQIVKRTN